VAQLAVVAATVRAGLAALLVSMVAVRLVSIAAVLASFWLWDSPVVSQDAVESPPITAMIRKGLPLAVSGVGLWLMHLGDRLVVGGSLGADALGRYSAIYGISLLVAAVNGPLNLPLYPRLQRSLAMPGAATREIRIFQRYATLLIVPAGAFIAATMDPLLAVLGGRGFRSDALLTMLLVLPVVVHQWNSAAHYVLLCADRMVLSQNLWLFAGALNIGLNLVLVPSFGLHGAAGATCVTFLLIDWAFFLTARRYLRLEEIYGFDVAARVAVSSLLAVAVIRFAGLLAPGLVSLAVAAIVFSAVYVATCMLLGEIRCEEARALITVWTRE
jgi:O-antigen/teichoic acid export membrane protein